MKNPVLEQLKGAKSAEEIVELFKKLDKEITLETAEKIFSNDNPEAELTEAELEAVTGGLRDKNGDLIILLPGSYVCNCYENNPKSRYPDRICLSCTYYRESFFYCHCGCPDFQWGGTVFY
ncbi:MAG: hypothetical protein LBL98_06295 [Ruminococcus sp.]|jgi:hypothetical protein|nr:hypothetical protein [Ruminococcus sp.]